MGIQGLLQFLKEASEPIHVMKFKGQTVAVDTYCWLHKGAFACADKLAKGENTDQYVVYCMKFVDMLLGCGVKPILVFDGCTLPSKKEVEKSRRERREINLHKGKQLLREGKLSEARECFTRCINVTPAMAHAVIKAARACGVDCIVAPYEADSQLAYLNKTGIAQAIITEDSDLLAFGCKKVILKMDKFGNGLEIDQSRLGMCKQLGDVFTEEKFRYMCILSGCDYLSSLHGIGLAKACKLLKIANNPDIIKVIKKIGQYLKMNIIVSEDYITGFIRANNTFLYQLVFDPLKRKLVPLNPYADDIDPETLDYAGRNIGNQAAFQIAIGNKDINTMEQIDNYNPDSAQTPQPKSRRWSDSVADKNTMLYSIWNRSFKPGQFNIHTSPTKTKEPGKQSTKGIEKVIRIKGLKLPRKEPNPKRPREELSDVDLFSQYSFSKKAKEESCEENITPQTLSATAPALHKSPSSGNENVNSQHKVRNKFATLLQRKNEEHGTVVVPGTRSRFFCNSVSDCSGRNEIHKSPLSPTSNGRNVVEYQSPNKDLLNLAEEDDVAQDIQLLDKMSDVEATKKERLDLPLSKGEEFELQSPNNEKCDSQSRMEDNRDAPSLEEENCGSQSSNEGRCRQTMLISPVRTPRSCFSWSSNLGGESTRTPISSPGLLALQQFHRKTDGPKNPVFQSNKWTRLQEGGVEVGNGVATVRDTESTPKSVGGWSQAQTNASKLSSKVSISEDSDNDGTFSSDLSSPILITNVAQKFHSAARNQVPGLHKSKSVGSCPTTKVKPLLPAKVSGLSRKSRSAPRKPLENDENKPGLQATISGLWKQFGFKKDVNKISPKSSEPLSPVKDNFSLTPEMDDDIYNKPECSRVQRAIF